MSRFAKIVATIGPACQDEDRITELLKAGVNVARLNFSHGTHEDHAQVIERLRRLASQLNRSIMILQDLQGPKIRTGQIGGGQIQLEPGQALTLTTQPVVGDARCVSVDFPQLIECARPGGRILLDDGNLELAITAVKADYVETRVVLGGPLKSHKGVNLPGADLDIPGFTEKDQDDLAFGLQAKVDAVAISFVRTSNDVQVVREAIKRLSPDRIFTPIVAKLERPEALKNLDQIVALADGVMVARGDLGVEMPPEMVPIAQKQIIECANRNAKVVITATQMLDSMIHNPRPTRAEASDVANAIFDGTDAVMLSGETAAGQYPVQAVETMDAIVRQAEAHLEWSRYRGPDAVTTKDDTYYMTQAASALASDRNVAAIAVFSRSGRTVRLMSKTRPDVPIHAFTPEDGTYNRMNLYWGVTPHLVPHVETIETMIEAMESVMLSSTPIQAGQQVVLVCGYPVLQVRPTNMVLLHTLGDKL
jgi:pyruvate kinase